MFDAASYTPKLIPGSLHPANKGAADWGWQGLMAYACHSCVVIVEPKTLQVVQTLFYRAVPICQVKWCEENYLHDLHSPYRLRLACADTHGHVTVWDALSATRLMELVIEGHNTLRPLAIEWLKGHEVSHDLLLVLYAPSTLVLWNADTGVRLWKTQAQDTITSLSVDPFNNSNMILMSNDWIMLVNDLNYTRPPAIKGRKFYIHNTSPSASTSSLNQGNKTPSKSTLQKIMNWTENFQGKAEDGEITGTDCVQVSYLPSNRNHALLLFPNEILILDMELGQAVGSFSIEASSPSFHSMVACRKRDVVYFLHDNGSISVRGLRSPDHVPYEQDTDPDQVLSNRITLDVLYDVKAHSDVFRLSRASRLMAFTLDPVFERTATIVLSDGRVLLWTLNSGIDHANDSAEETLINTEAIPSEGNSSSSQKCGDVKGSISQIFPLQLTFKDPVNNIARPKFLLDGLLEGVAFNPHCVYMCPPMTTKNLDFYKSLLAIGCGNGVLQIFEASTGHLYRSYSLPVSSIKGVEWLSLSSLLVYFDGSVANNKSEIGHININSGKMKTLPSTSGLKNSTIALLKVSHLRHYFLVLFTNHCVELWDANSLCQLRELPTKFPKITAFEWSPSNKRFGKKRKQLEAKSLDESTSEVLEENKENSKPAKQVNKVEHLVFSDHEGTIYHYVVEGTSLKDGSKVPPETGMGVVSCIVWKGEMLAIGDVDGNLNFWDLKAKVSRVYPTHMGGVKRMKFAPGKGNMRLIVLCNDGVHIYETLETKSLASLKTSKDDTKIVDVDWLSSSAPILLLSSGSVRILDATLKEMNCAMTNKKYHQPIFYPRILEPSKCLKLKGFLQHQRWRDKYCASSCVEDEILQTQLNLMPRELCDKFNTTPSTAERCKYIAEMLGDESGMVFWEVASHYLSLAKQNKSQQLDENSPTGEVCTQPLDTCFDLLCDNTFYKKLQLYRIGLLDSHRTTYEHTRLCAQKLILAGQTDRAVHVLLEGEPSEASYYSDALRACLIATVTKSGSSESTVKLVATNLIASGKLTEGVELLCLVNKGADACRYLQTYGEWSLAVWLAKVRLGWQECNDVITRWCDHLASHNKTMAILVLLSMGKFVKSLEHLFSIGHVERALLLLEACEECQVIDVQDQLNCALFENIYLDYARLQFKLKNAESAKFYCSKAGGRGRKLLEEHSS